MAKKAAPAPKTASKSTPAAKAATAPVSTPVRNSAVPKPQTAAAKAKVITHDDIAQRAYFISQSGTGGSEYDNWVRAERELRGS